MSIDVRDGEQPMGRLLYLPLNTVAGDFAALRGELVARLQERRPAVVDEMVQALHRAGLVPVLQVGEVPVAERLDTALCIILAAWEHRRPLHPAELDALRALGRAVAGADVPLWRLLRAVHQATVAGWQYVLQHALALGDSARRPGSMGQLIAELSTELLEVVGRIESQMAAGYAETGTGGVLRLPAGT
jgi:hypothetical protein